MGWRDRAEKVASTKPTPWKLRASRVELDLSEPSVKPDDSMSFSALESGAFGVGQGASLGLGDEIAGGLSAAGTAVSDVFGDDGRRGYEYGEQKPTTIKKYRTLPSGERKLIGEKINTPTQLEPDPEPTLADVYRENRDDARRIDNRAREQHPYAFGAGEIAGDALLQVPLAIASGGSSLTPAGQAALGGASGLGHSDADLTSGKASDFAKAGLETGLGAGLSYGASKAGGAFADWVRNSKLSRALQSKISKASDDAIDLATSGADKNIASLGGELGSAVQQGSRSLENIGREVSNVGPDLQSAARQLTETGAPQELRETVFSNTLERLPGQVSKVSAAKKALEEAVSNRSSEIARRTEDLLSNPIRKQLVPRLKTYASRAIPIAVGTGIAGSVGGWPGMIAGGVVGSATAAAMGRPGTAFANAMKSPGVRKAAWELVQDALINAPAKLGGYAGAFATATTPLAVHATLENEPKYQAMLENLFNEAQEQ